MFQVSNYIYKLTKHRMFPSTAVQKIKESTGDIHVICRAYKVSFSLRTWIRIFSLIHVQQCSFSKTCLSCMFLKIYTCIFVYFRSVTIIGCIVISVVFQAVCKTHATLDPWESYVLQEHNRVRKDASKDLGRLVRHINTCF